MTKKNLRPITGISGYRSILGILLSGLSVGAIAACSPFPSYEADSSQPDAASSPSEVSSEEEQLQTSGANTRPIPGEFQFPMESCGDAPDTPVQVWYPVFVDGADIDEIRTKFCQDAVSTVRSESGVTSVQVASFTSFDKAARFATLVDGEIERLDSNPNSESVASLNPSPSSSPSDTAEIETTAETETASPSTAAPTRRTGVLSAAEAGAEINVRGGAGTTFPVQHVGYSGDRVRIIDEQQGSDGATWYSVRFESGETGWVRDDLISVSGSSSTDSPTAASSSRDRSSTIGSAPSTSPPQTEASRPSTSTARTGSATLSASEAGSAINVRNGAGTSAPVMDVAYDGDPIRITGEAQGDDGYTWYEVELESGTSGWVREDLVSN